MNIMNTIKAIIILQVDGRRTLVRYFDEKLNSRQFEKRLYSKTKNPKTKDEILVVDGVLIVHKFITDSHLYIVGGRNENPLILETVLNCLAEVISSLSTNSMNTNTVSDNLGRVILALDEICDDGMILEIDPNLVLQRISPPDESVESMAQRTARRIFGI